MVLWTPIKFFFQKVPFFLVVLDVNEQTCQKAAFQTAPDGTNRQWDIRVTQYECGQDDKAGPPGCLQYYTGTAGTLQSFNFPPGATTVPTTATHLQNQNYQVCFRRESGYCHLCFIASITAAAPNSFGLSVSIAAAAQAASGTHCTTDYITIPNGLEGNNIAAGSTATTAGVSRFCGRFLNSLASTSNLSVCSKYE